MVKLDKVRADTTVVPANVAYPTDSGLLAKGVAKLTKTVGAINAAGLARRTHFRDRTRSVRRRAHQIAAWLRRRSGEAKDEVLVLTGELATIAEASHQRRPGRGQKCPPGAAPGRRGSLGQGERTRRRARAHDHRPRASRGPDRAPDSAARSPTDRRASCRSTTPTPGPSPRDAWGVRSSSASRHRWPTTPTASWWTTASRWATRPTLRCSGPPSAASSKRFSKVPRAATADRGYGEAKVEDRAPRARRHPRRHPAEGTSRCARQGVESARRFRKLVKWRTGSEGRISYLKHSWGWERTRIDGIDGARTWCGWGVLAHNATKIAVLIDERGQNNSPTPSRQATIENLLENHQDAPRQRRTEPLPDLAPILSRRALRAGNGRKTGSKATGEVGAGARWAHAAVTQDSWGIAPKLLFQGEVAIQRVVLGSSRNPGVSPLIRLQPVGLTVQASVEQGIVELDDLRAEDASSSRKETDVNEDEIQGLVARRAHVVDA